MGKRREVEGWGGGGGGHAEERSVRTRMSLELCCLIGRLGRIPRKELSSHRDYGSALSSCTVRYF